MKWYLNIFMIVWSRITWIQQKNNFSHNRQLFCMNVITFCRNNSPENIIDLPLSTKSSWMSIKRSLFKSTTSSSSIAGAEIKKAWSSNVSVLILSDISSLLDSLLSSKAMIFSKVRQPNKDSHWWRNSVRKEITLELWFVGEMGQFPGFWANANHIK